MGVNDGEITDEERKKRRIPKAIRILFGFILGFVLISVSAFFIYVSFYYKADSLAWDVINEKSDLVKIEKTDDGYVFKCDNPKAGIIFYPGGKVECEAYAPLMKALCERGYMCVLLKVNFNLAILEIDAAKGVKEKYPEISRWYIGGHSLGGVIAAEYIDEHIEDFEGLILLASYPAIDISDNNTKAITIYGSKDEILSNTAYEEGRAMLPNGYKEVIIEGGCHSYFGYYGYQKGDGEPDISREEQISITVDSISELIDN